MHLIRSWYAEVTPNFQLTPWAVNQDLMGLSFANHRKWTRRDLLLSWMILDSTTYGLIKKTLIVTGLGSGLGISGLRFFPTARESLAQKTRVSDFHIWFLHWCWNCSSIYWDGVLSEGNSRSEYLIETITNASYVQSVINWHFNISGHTPRGGGGTSFRNLVTLCASCNQKLASQTYREQYRLAGLQSGYEPSLLNASGSIERAFFRAFQFSSNMMHTRCELY